MIERRDVNLEARAVLCPAYRVCLDQAIRDGSTGFSCKDCEKRGEVEPITVEEVIRCGVLLRHVFLRDRPATIRTVCPRCGQAYTRESVEGGSSRRFCPACATYAGSSWASGVVAESLTMACRGDEVVVSRSFSLFQAEVDLPDPPSTAFGGHMRAFYV